MKSLYPILTFLFLSSWACSPALKKNHFYGKAQGSTYSIIYYAANPIEKAGIDSILQEMDNYFSLWHPHSFINQFNSIETDTLRIVKDQHFYKLLEASKSIYLASDQLFDPSVYPLLKQWGFGKDVLDSNINIDEAKKLVNYNGIDWVRVHENTTVSKATNQSVDFNSIAQGYTVDVISEYLEQQGIYSYMVEVGGELRLGHKKPNGQLWSVGIDKPIENAVNRELIDTLYLENAAIATSGSYRKFYVKNGKKFSHSINPKTGYPVQHNTLSVTVITQPPNCTQADGWATAFMVMGDEGIAKHLQKGQHVISIVDSASVFNIKRY